jgi:putative transposase
MRRARLLGRGPSNIYHCMARAINGEMIFGEREKQRIHAYMRAVEAFTGVTVMTYTILTNHTHILLEVPQAPVLDEAEIMRRVKGLYDKAQVYELEQRLKRARRDGGQKLVEQILDTYRARMYDLSEFMKMLQQRISQSYNRRHGRRGPLWQDRFKSVCVEGKRNAIITMAAYIDLNPVRAGIVDDPRHYRFCGYGEAVAGKDAARAGIRAITAFLGQQDGTWRQHAASYRKHLFMQGKAKPATENSAGRRGFSDEEIEKVLKEKGKLTLAQGLHCRVRYFTDGVVLGSREFVDDLFQHYREEFSLKRKTGARPMKHADWQGLCTMRDLRCRVIGAPQRA